jgi:hypothetical protein
MGLCSSKESVRASSDPRVTTHKGSPVATVNNHLVGSYVAFVTEVYDGDTFTCYFEKDRLRCLIKVRVIGYNAEEINDKKYSRLKQSSPANDLESRLNDFFNKPASRISM